MSDYGHYSSDEDSIDLPKTPGAPLNTNRSDDSDVSDKNVFDDSNESSENKRNQPEVSSESDSDKSDDSASEDEDSDNVNSRRKNHKNADESRLKRRLSSSSSEGEENKQKENNSSDNDNDNNLKEIFGDLSDEDANEQQAQNSDIETNENKEQNSDQENENKSEDENENYMNAIFGDDDDQDQDQVMDEEEPQPEETSIEVFIPLITADLGEKIHFVKLPNFISIDTHPYDPLTYEDEIDEDEIHDDEGRARLKLKVENTIRWRKLKDDDQEMLESNARVVKWSDGSMSLHLGDEIFDMQALNLLPGENNHLFVRQGTGLQGQSIFKTKLTFRPFSTESFTHRKLTLSLADKSQKSQKICVLPNVGKDPEANRSEMIKKEEVKLKASIRKENKTRKIKDRSYRGSSSLLDIEDDDDESISISKIKNQYKRATVQSNAQYSDYEESDNYEEEDDDSDLDFDKKKSSEKKRIVDSDDED